VSLFELCTAVRGGGDLKRVGSCREVQSHVVYRLYWWKVSQSALACDPMRGFPGEERVFVRVVLEPEGEHRIY
jgi:hypothetical protein